MKIGVIIHTPTRSIGCRFPRTEWRVLDHFPEPGEIPEPFCYVLVYDLGDEDAFEVFCEEIGHEFAECPDLG